MADDPIVSEPITIPLPPKNFMIDGESKIFNVTIRGWIAVELVTTVCLMAIFKIDIKEPLYTLVVMAVSFYLGTKNPSMTMMNQSKP